jgi:hypothetical protein
LEAFGSGEIGLGRRAALEREADHLVLGAAAPELGAEPHGGGECNHGDGDADDHSGTSTT